VNATLDAVIEPLSVAASYVDRISKGDIPEKITDPYRGEFAALTNNLNQCIEAIERLIEDAASLSQSAIAGQLSSRADVSKHEGDYRKIVAGVNATLDAVIKPLNVAADYVDKISKGEIPPPITVDYAGDFGTLKNNLNQCIVAVNLLVNDAQTLVKAAVDGRLSIRADATKHQGDFRKIVAGVNATLDAVISPLNVAASCVDRISRGDIPPRIEENYAGDFGALKNNLNQCIDAINRLVSDAKMLSQAAVEGKLSTRADAKAHQGDFNTIVAGVNATLDSVIGPLTVAATYVARISKGDIPQKITDEYEGDFNAIKNNLNQCIDAVNLLVADSQALSVSAIQGKLSTRADASRHAGDFRRVVDGINQTLDAIVLPIVEATRVLESLAQYDLRVRVKGEYQGDHARIKEALNGTATALHDALVQVAEAVEHVAVAARQIASSSQSVAQGASEQASSLEETSSSLEEMASMTKHNADNTVQARSLSQMTKHAAEHGGSSMTRMTDAMEKIRTAAEGTAQIIKDINDIAFQTNLLALNAAVEAARAGEAGRGFAVVAEEVRNLAQRSKEAAKKTEDLIRMSVGNAENGRQITTEVATSLIEIVGAAGKVNDIISEIAVASQEQSRGIEQVNVAVSEMDKVVQAAAANAEESSSASEELSSQSEELASLVSRFQIDRSSIGGTGNRTSVGNERPSVRAGELRQRSSLTSPRRVLAPKPPVRQRTMTDNASRVEVLDDELLPLNSQVTQKEGVPRVS
jgi:methyl-accepting chemotaxis protein